MKNYNGILTDEQLSFITKCMSNAPIKGGEAPMLIDTFNALKSFKEVPAIKPSGAIMPRPKKSARH